MDVDLLRNLLCNRCAYSVRDFVNVGANELKMQIDWEGHGLDEKVLMSGKCIVRVDPSYFRAQSRVITWRSV